MLLPPRRKKKWEGKPLQNTTGVSKPEASPTLFNKMEKRKRCPRVRAFLTMPFKPTATPLGPLGAHCSPPGQGGLGHQPPMKATPAGALGRSWLRQPLTGPVIDWSVRGPGARSSVALCSKLMGHREGDFGASVRSVCSQPLSRCVAG